MKQINVLYDAATLFDSNKSMTSRTGIFWCAYNILKQFKNNSLFNIKLLIPPHIFLLKRHELDIFLSSFPKIIQFDRIKYKRNLNVHLFFLKTENKIFNKFIRLVKIFKNIFMLFLSYICIPSIKNIDIYFSPAYTVPEFINKKNKIKAFQFLHDSIPFLDNLGYNNKLKPDHWLNESANNLNKDTYYFCNSECTKNDYLNLFPDKIDKNKIFTTFISSSQIFFPDYDKLKLKNILLKYKIELKPGDSYIFSLCSIDPRKNLIFTIKCFLEFICKNNINNLYFFLGGTHFPDYINEFLNEISAFKEYHDRIIQLGYVNDEDVNILYSNSYFFTFLSQYEGFGMPVLEAMQAGTSVICSNNSSLPEVSGDAAISINYNDEEACIKAFGDFYFNEDLRNEYIRRGIERAKLFSWEKTFAIMNEKIQNILLLKSKE